MSADEDPAGTGKPAEDAVPAGVETPADGVAPSDGPADPPRGAGEHRPINPIFRARQALHRQIDRADQWREADRALVMRLDAPIVSNERRDAPAPAPEKAARVRVVGEVATRSATLDSLPSWLVRGGVGAWLLLGIVAAVSLVFIGTAQVIPVFIGVFIALVITAILYPLVSFFARFMPRYPATFLGLLTALAVVAALIAYVVSSVTSQWDSLARQFSDGLDTIVDFLEHGPLPVHLTQQELVNTVQNLVEQGQEYVQSNAPSLAGEVLSNAGSIVDVFVVLALALFTAIFLLASGGRMWRWFLNELPARLRERVHRAAGAGWYTFAGYARGTVILALTDAVMAGVFLQVVIDSSPFSVIFVFIFHLVS